MENSKDFKGLVRKTCWKIVGQFAASLILLYILPLMSVSFEMQPQMGRGGNEAASIYLNVFSWMYICAALVVIISLNMRQLLATVGREMQTVYHKSLWLKPPVSEEKLTLREFIETRQHIETMQKKISDLLENEKQQKAELIFQVSAAAHDLKSPLTVILGNAQLLQQTSLAQAREGQYLKDLQHACLSLEHYFNEMIAYAKTFYEDRKVWPKQELKGVIDGVKQTAKGLFKAKEQLVIIDEIKIDGLVQWNADAVTRAVVNILQNAQTYSKTAQPLTVLTLTNEAHKISFAIWNQGSNFSPDVLANFDKLFYRQDHSRGMAGELYGIGLAFVKRVALLHQGDVQLSNTPDGALVVLTLALSD